MSLQQLKARAVPTDFARSPKPRHRGEAMGLWAVSYSDLLMVLLAFFVMYFEYGEKESTEIIRNLSRDLTQTRNPNSAYSGEPIGPEPLVGPNAVAQVGKLLKDDGFHAEPGKKPGTLVVHFPENYYELGKYEIRGQQEEWMQQLLRVLLPQKKRISIVFIGHADTLAFNKNAKIIDSNLVLSNLRGARAAEYALLHGFDPRMVSSQGVGEYRRASRTLSVQIEERPQ